MALDPPCDSTRMEMPVFRMDWRSAPSLAAAALTAAGLIPARLAMVFAVATEPLVFGVAAGAAGRTVTVAVGAGAGAGPGAAVVTAGTVVGAVGSFSQRASLKIAVASETALTSFFAPCSATR